jgi:hypothetical protein
MRVSEGPDWFSSTGEREALRKEIETEDEEGDDDDDDDTWDGKWWRTKSRSTCGGDGNTR